MRRLMIKPTKTNPAQSGGRWASLSDEELLKHELKIDDPENLTGLVHKVPPGEAESYIEYTYDFRGTDKEEVHCAHCNQGHKFGCVVNKGGVRFPVGHVCGGKIYGVKFDELKVDFDAAVVRRDIARRVAHAREALEPFRHWLAHVLQSEVFSRFERVRSQMETRMPLLFEGLRDPAICGRPIRVGSHSCILPAPTFFNKSVDPAARFREGVAAFSAISLRLISKGEQEAALQSLFVRVRGLLTTIEAVLSQLKEVEDLFQPSVLLVVAEWATTYDDSGKRTYVAGLMNITCKHKGKDVTVEVPRKYRVPSREPIATLRAALNDALIE
jgi:hypothetical protein